MSCMKCPASMCPLIAPTGSPWTGQFDVPCPGHDDIDTDGCAWWSMACGNGGGGIMASVIEAELHDGKSHVAGPNKPRRQERMLPKTYDCPKAHECRWQEQAVDLCPPREALRRGIDPRVCLF